MRFGTRQHCGPIPAGEHAAKQSPVLIWHPLFAEWHDPSAVGQPVVSEMASAQPFQKAGFLAVGHSSNVEAGPYKQMYMTSAPISSTTQGRF